MFVWCECCVLSGRGLCDELITRPGESYRLWCVVVCDLETSWLRRPWPTGGCRVKNIYIVLWSMYTYTYTLAYIRTYVHTYMHRHIRTWICIKVKQSHYRSGQALRVPESESYQTSGQTAHEGCKDDKPTHRPFLPHRKYSWYSFLFYKQEGRGFDSRCCYWNFSLT
jgi:hypothetical protein